MRPRLKNIKHELVFSTERKTSDSRDVRSGDRPPLSRNDGNSEHEE